LAGIPFQLSYYGSGWRIDFDGVGSGDLDDSFRRRHHDLEIVRYGDPYDYVISANIRRRHHTSEQKRDLIANVLKAKPALSNVQVAKLTKATDKTVAKVRAEKEATSEIPRLKKTVGADGKSRKAKIPKPKSDPKLLQDTPAKLEGRPLTAVTNQLIEAVDAVVERDLNLGFVTKEQVEDLLDKHTIVNGESSVSTDSDVSRDPPLSREETAADALVKLIWFVDKTDAVEVASRLRSKVSHDPIKRLARWLEAIEKAVAAEDGGAT
jgi:hypothetical protein